MDWNDVSRIAETHDEVMEALNAGKPNVAAELLCKRLNWLVENGSFWVGLREAAESVAELRVNDHQKTYFSEHQADSLRSFSLR